MMLEGWSIVKGTLVAVPDAETLPVPSQPVQTYSVTIDAVTGELTEAGMDVPASNQLLIGVGEP
jgi:hypothetical protein